MFWTVILFLALLSVLVLVHEWGHYAAAKRSGMKVEEFGLGFPPRLFGKKGKDGMIWSVNAIPLGGFVKIKGEGGDHAGEPDSFASKSLWKRFVVLIAGVTMNLVLAAALFSVGFGFGLPAVVEGGTDPSAVITDKALHVVEVVEGSPADQAGMEIGDRVISIDGTAYETGEEARGALAPNEDGSPIKMVIARDGEVVDVNVTPAYLEVIQKEGVGIGLVQTGTLRYPWYVAPVKGVQMAVVSTVQVVQGFGSLIVGLVSKDQAVAELSGPVGIAVLTGQVAELGASHLVQFAAMLSVNLAVINVLPFPALDGGRILFLAIEAIRRRPASAKVEQAIHATGFAILLLIVILVTYKDIVNFF